MVVTTEKDNEFDGCAKKSVDETIDIDKHIETLETGVIHKKDDVYTLDNRWEFKYSSYRDVVLVSAQFMKDVVAATYSVNIEWGGLIFGRVKLLKDGCTIFICERVAIMAQNRTSGSFEIKDEHYKNWVLTPEFTDFVGAGFKRIGWVHSHVKMGCFWSGIDDATIRQLIAEEANSEIISLVVSKRDDKKLDTYYRPSNRGMRNGIEYLIPDVKTTIPLEQVYLETAMPSYDDIDKEYAEAMKAKMDATQIIETPTTTQYANDDPYGAQYEYGYGTYATTNDTTVNADMTVNLFALITSGYNAKVRNLFEEESIKKHWKMKGLVKELATPDMSEHLISMLDFFLKTPTRPQQFLYRYKNFDSLSAGFRHCIESLCKTSESYKNFINARYGLNWVSQFNDTLVKKSYTVVSSRPATTSYVASAMRTNKYDWEEYLKTFDESLIRKTTDILIGFEGPLFMTMFTKLVEGIEWRIRNEEDSWSVAFANIYVALKKYQQTIEKKEDQAKYEEFLIRLLGEAFEGFKINNKQARHALQVTVNNLPDEFVSSFLYDFVVEYDSEEKLDELYLNGEISVRRKMYGCPICKTWYLTKEESQKCREVCEKIDKKKAVSTIKSAVVVDKSPKGTAATAHWAGTTIQQTLETSGNAGMTRLGQNICGMPQRYWLNKNICSHCGIYYKDETRARACETACALAELELVARIFNDIGYITCPACGETIMDEEDYHNHNAICSTFGSTIHARLIDFVIKNSDAQSCFYLDFPEACADEFDNLMNAMSNGLVDGDALPSIIWYIQEKLESRESLILCNKCGKNFIHLNDAVEAVYACCWHETYCRENIMATPAMARTDATVYADPSDDETNFCEYTRTPNNPYLYICNKCKMEVYSGGPFMNDILIKHYIDKHGGRPGMGLSILYESSFDKPIKVEGKVNLLYKHHCYFCLDCNGTIGYGTEDGLLYHLKTIHKIDGRNADYMITISHDSELEIKNSYNAWLEEHFKNKPILPINICRWCGKAFEALEKLEDNAQLCHRHEYMCGERFKKDESKLGTDTESI